MLTSARDLRESLDLTFDGQRQTLELAASILVHNGAIAALPIAAAMAAPHAHSGFPAFADTVLGGAAALNLVMAGVAISAYPADLPRHAALHAPVELAGFATAGALYVLARRKPTAPRVVLTATAATLAVLAAAAVLEAFAAGSV